MIAMDDPGKLFTRIDLKGYRWKPKPDYMNQLFFLGTYLREELPGIYYSIYATKDWKNLLQIAYANPGNMIFVNFFGKDSVNMLRQKGMIIDPREEYQEPERPVVAGNQFSISHPPDNAPLNNP